MGDEACSHNTPRRAQIKREASQRREERLGSAKPLEHILADRRSSMLQELSDWLSQTQLNTIFSDTTRLETWLIIPLSQSIHILGIAIVMIAVGMINLQLLGFRVTRQSFAEHSARWMPWIWTGMAILLVTGLMQTIAEPTREIMNYTFRIKMVMLAIVLAITVAYRQAGQERPQLLVRRTPDFGSLLGVPLARSMAWHRRRRAPGRLCGRNRSLSSTSTHKRTNLNVGPSDLD